MILQNKTVGYEKDKHLVGVFVCSSYAIRIVSRFYVQTSSNQINFFFVVKESLSPIHGDNLMFAFGVTYFTNAVLDCM